MTDERPTNKELIAATLGKLDRVPVSWQEMVAIIPAMREGLIGAGVRLELSEAGTESLKQRQFRSLDTGRGPGMVEALGQERAEGLLDWCVKHGKRKIGGKEGTEGRGLQQTAADILLLLTDKELTDEKIGLLTLKINQRVKKGLGNKTVEAWDQIPKLEPDEKWRQMASVPAGTVAKLWQWLSSKPSSGDESVV